MIDMALFDTMVGTLANQATNYLVSGDAPTRLGNAHPNIVPYQVFRAADGWLIIAVGNDAQFARLAKILGLEMREEWRTNAGRVADRERLSRAIGQATAMQGRNDLLRECEAQGIPAGPINDVAQALADPQIAARSMVVELDNGQPALRTPLRFSDSALAVGRDAPRLGKDN